MAQMPRGDPLAAAPYGLIGIPWRHNYSLMAMDHTAASKARLASYWEGPVTWVERLCAASMLRQGHELTIYTHDPASLTACNSGAETCDARDVVPEKHVAHRYRTVGRFNTFSNLFRLELQRQNKGVWVDLDCYFIRPLVPRSEYVFGLMASKRPKLNGAVLGLPSDCPMIADYMAAITADPLRVPWASFRRRLRREVEILMGRSQPHASVRTDLGPRALTYFAGKHSVLAHAMPIEAFYAIADEDVPLLVDPDPTRAAAKLTARTILVHLWRSKFKRLGLLEHLPPATSFLGTACAELGITTVG